jgi:hypothetical protein
VSVELPRRWAYFYRHADGRYVLAERGDYRGDFPTLAAMLAYLKNVEGVLPL